MATWNPSDKGTTNTILSNGNLTYGAGASNTTNDGCRSTIGVPTGNKFYFEMTCAGSTATVMMGVGNLSSGFSQILSGSGGSFAVFSTNGHIWNNNSDTTISIGTPIANDVYCYAIDLANNRGWIRKNGGNWNNNATYNPATNVGGQDISWLTPAVFALVASNANANPIVTLNLGASAFAQAVPSGFVSYLTAVTYMQVTQVALEQWASIIPPQMQVTQDAIEQWASTGIVIPRLGGQAMVPTGIGLVMVSE